MERQLDSASPGPAAYATTSHDAALRPVSPRVLIGTAPRSPRSPGADGPGPADYNFGAHDAALRPLSPRTVIGRAGRDASSSEGAPGPGACEWIRTAHVYP